MKKIPYIFLTLVGSPAMGAGDGYEPGYGFTSLFNTDYVVLIGFLLFLAIIFYFNVPSMLGKMLDQRADGIKSELDEARKLREDAQALLASYERKQREVAEQSERIVAAAKLDAEKAAAKARTDLQSSIERRLKAAEDQITSAEEKAIRAVRNRAIQVATTAVADVMAKTISTTSSDELIDASIAEIDRHLH